MKGFKTTISALVAIVVLCAGTVSTSMQSQTMELMRHLKWTYQTHMKPDTFYDSELQRERPLLVNLSVSLVNVLYADEAANTLDVVIKKTLDWNTNLEWGSIQNDDFGNITTLKFPTKHLWVPDVVPYETLASPVENLLPAETDVYVNPNGDAMYMSLQRVRIFCDVTNVESEDGAECWLNFGSWSYNGFELELQLKNSLDSGIGLYDYFMGSKYEILHSSATRKVLQYACCPEPYFTIRYLFTIRSKARKLSWSFF